MSKTKQLIHSFESGNELTSDQISKKFGFKSPGRAVAYLREQGYCIYSNVKSASATRGRPSVTYRLGTPTKRMVALASRVIGAEAFTAR